jgi:lipid II:glycine glycyltransferase (peptidoglycan interpeptide bridge formation enzyme)
MARTQADFEATIRHADERAARHLRTMREVRDLLREHKADSAIAVALLLIADELEELHEQVAHRRAR